MLCIELLPLEEKGHRKNHKKGGSEESKMVTFQRMRDEFDNLESQVATKFPRLGKSGCLAILATVVFVIFVLGLAIGYGVRGDRRSPYAGGASSVTQVSG